MLLNNDFAKPSYNPNTFRTLPTTSVLYRDFLLNKGRGINKYAYYLPTYERHFSRFVNQSIVFWEIGVARGGSLQMWKRYFGPFATIVGIDISQRCKKYEENQIHIRIGDQTDTSFLQRIIEEFGPPDIVLDDGSHIMEHVCKTWGYLYEKLNKNGVYLIEDLHTAYINSFGGGLKREGTFIELCKVLVEHLRTRQDSFANSTYSMSFYDSIVAFEKRRLEYVSYENAKRSPVYNCLDKFKYKPAVLWTFNAGVEVALEWKQHLGPFAAVVGINLKEDGEYTASEQIHLYTGNPSDHAYLQSIIDKFGAPDIILDNRTRGEEIVLATYDFLYDKIGKDAVYLIEGLTENSEDSGNNIFSNRCKEQIDFLNAKHNQLDASFAGMTYSISFYTDCIAYEKKLMSDSAVMDFIIPFTLKDRIIKMLQALKLYDIVYKAYKAVFK